MFVTTLHALEACLKEGQSFDWQVINEIFCNMRDLILENEGKKIL